MGSEFQREIQTDLQRHLQELNQQSRQQRQTQQQQTIRIDDLIDATPTSNIEKPTHYTYLKGFRVNQCQLFVQHKCTNHKPYLCFDWHFQNQRRRRPIRRRDGTFNYSADNYCEKYDETTGLCPDGDECPLLHKTAGDTERRYHLRYYKTSMCVYETDARGHCAKNGKHCAFAHGAQDLRNPVFDIRELKHIENGSNGELSDPSGVLNVGLERERNAVLEDPRWSDIAFVLANYKTEICNRPPRYCRQGYACPQYHNGKDRRRSPKLFKYRSTPCPNTKQGDEWVDPSKCEQGDNCPYCHSRTEQQFHPEIFKSSKCKDIQDAGHCPRGAFCAFAHNDEEMVATRDINLQIIDTTKQEHNDVSTWLGVSFADAEQTDTVELSPTNLLSSTIAAPQSDSTTKNTLGPIARPRSYSHSQARVINTEYSQLHAAIARARLIDEFRMQNLNLQANLNPTEPPIATTSIGQTQPPPSTIGFRERAVQSFSIPSATDATQLLFSKDPSITALDFLPSRLSNLNISSEFQREPQTDLQRHLQELNPIPQPQSQSTSQQQLPNDELVDATPTSNVEKPTHYTYLKGFRVNQCQLFVQHKCANHKPYLCFDWHFQNQRRRRPIRRRDGTFNYSADNYCEKYDETTGLCPDGDECPLLHKTAGDTERRYHLRYYKTSMCVYETDARGHCAKNGKHCAFAHGAQDLRNPVFDIRELKHIENGSNGELSDPSGVLNVGLERERNAVLEDPRWSDIAFVLANYKTEICNRPPRYCRQGYACPQYHNGKDRRRSPKLFKYRSTPCPNTKQGDEWVDPSKCEQGDNCPYCHSRTEQQFHPEIFKSSKCKDIQDAGHCPRGAFCAFAHNDKEMVATRDIQWLEKLSK